MVGRCVDVLLEYLCLEKEITSNMTKYAGGSIVEDRT